MPMSCGPLSKKAEVLWPDELRVGDCWVALSLAKDSGLVLSGLTRNFQSIKKYILS